MAGIYPNCKCNLPKHIFSAYLNQCYIECENGSEGIHPRCRCSEPGTVYNADEFKCSHNIGRKCPPGSVGIGPECLCMQEHHIFIQSRWTCALASSSAHPSIASCPDGNKYPQCGIEIERTILLTLVGWENIFSVEVNMQNCSTLLSPSMTQNKTTNILISVIRTSSLSWTQKQY